MCVHFLEAVCLFVEVYVQLSKLEFGGQAVEQSHPYLVYNYRLDYRITMVVVPLCTTADYCTLHVHPTAG